MVRFLILFTLCVFSITTPLKAQVDSTKTQPVTVMPSFPGGDESMYKFVYAELKYPKEARINKIEGSVIGQFEVSEDGTMENIKLVRKIGYGCDEEAMRILTKMKEDYKWTPGTHNGEPHRLTYALPISFKLK